MHFMPHVASIWGAWKIEIEQYLGLSADALHVQVGVLLLLLFALLTRRRLYQWLPWWLVLIVELVNETIDMNQPGSIEANWPASQHDILNTMFLPTILVTLLKLRNKSFLRPEPHR